MAEGFLGNNTSLRNHVPYTDIRTAKEEAESANAQRTNAITMLVLFAGPISTYTEATRYVLPMLYIVPLFLFLTLGQLQSEDDR